MTPWMPEPVTRHWTRPRARGPALVHPKTQWRTAIIDYAPRDPCTGGLMGPRRMSRFKRRRLERTPSGRMEIRKFEKARTQMAEAAAVTKDAKQRLKDAAEGR